MYSCIHRMNQDSFLDPFSSSPKNNSEDYDPQNDLLIEQINTNRQPYDERSTLDTLFANVFDPSLSDQVLPYEQRSPINEQHQRPGPSTANHVGVQIIPAEIAKNPPPAYENVVFTDQGSPMSDISHLSGESISFQKQPVKTLSKSGQSRSYRTSRIRSGPYEKYKDESGKIKVEEISDPVERERVLEKREKNRVAAEKARHKKRERIDELEREKRRLEDLIAASDLDAVRIQRNLDYLRVSFQEHEKVCCFKK